MVSFLFAGNPDVVQHLHAGLGPAYSWGTRPGGVTKTGDAMIHQGAYEAGIQNIRLHRPPLYYGQHIGQNVVQSFQVPANAGAWTT